MTKTNVLRDEIKRFLSSDLPEIICIKGEWGVGKTFTWDRLFREAIDEKRFALNRYSYVSLFGVRSLDDLKQAIVGTVDFAAKEKDQNTLDIAKKGLFNRLGSLFSAAKDAEEIELLGGIIKAARARRRGSEVFGGDISQGLQILFRGYTTTKGVAGGSEGLPSVRLGFKC